jgi:ferredoxin
MTEPKSDALIVFTPSGKRGRFALGTPVLQAARALGVDIDSVCGGRAICGRCQVTVSEGEFAKHAIVSRASHITPATRERAALRREAGAQARPPAVVPGAHRRRRGGRRAVGVPGAQAGGAQARRHPPDRHGPGQPALLRRGRRAGHAPSLLRPRAAVPGPRDAVGGHRRHHRSCHHAGAAEGSAPGRMEGDGGHPSPAGRRRQAHHRHLAGLPRPRLRARHRHRLDHHRRPPDQPVHRRGLRVGRADEPADPLRRGPDEPGVLRDDEPRRRQGDDCGGARGHQHAGARGGRRGRHRGLRHSRGGGGRQSRSCTICFSASIRPSSAARRFALATGLAVTRPAREFDLEVNPGGYVYLLPCIAGHVGADAAGVVLSESPHLSDDIMLVVDVGTNAEIILGNRDRLLACSSPTGPAFEGAQISCGQRAAPGAIDRVRIDPEPSSRASR